MINEKIHVLKLVTAFLDLHHDDHNKPRFSLLDMQIFLIINNSSGCGKNDLLEKINGSTTSKSFIDRPIQRLLKYKLINRTQNPSACTRQGEARITYKVSKIGSNFIRKCSFSV